MKVNEKIEQYLDPARELKMLKNKNVIMISIVVYVLETFPKGLENKLEELEIRGRIETIQTAVVCQSSVKYH